MPPPRDPLVVVTTPREDDYLVLWWHPLSTLVSFLQAKRRAHGMLEQAHRQAASASERCSEGDNGQQEGGLRSSLDTSVSAYISAADKRIQLHASLLIIVEAEACHAVAEQYAHVLSSGLA